MRVYVLEVGAYTNQRIQGVFRSVGAAMAAHCPAKPPAETTHSYEWERNTWGCRRAWIFYGGDDNVADITEFEVI